MKTKPEDSTQPQKHLGQSFWGKTSEKRANQNGSDRRYHPLLFHMLDVAAVAGLVWDYWLALPLRRRIERSFGTAAKTHFVFLAGTHDVGKASPGFQKKAPELSRDSEPPFSQNDKERPHGNITAHVLKDVLGPSPASALLGQITGAHHGVFPRSGDLTMGRGKRSAGGSQQRWFW